MLESTKKPSLFCPFCSVWFKTIKQFYNHEFRKHKKFECNDCGLFLEGNNRAKTHICGQEIKKGRPFKKRELKQNEKEDSTLNGLLKLNEENPSVIDIYSTNEE
jgi:hypothetical protein